jgi:hypothetical protein
MIRTCRADGFKKLQSDVFLNRKTNEQLVFGFSSLSTEATGTRGEKKKQ